MSSGQPPVQSDRTENEQNTEDSSATTCLDPAELPFLVTHWLSHYSRQSQGQGGSSTRRQEAISRLQEAANQVASAFSDLGAFGVFHLPQFQRHARSSSRNATYCDMTRRWQNVSPQHLEMVVESAASSAAATAISIQNKKSVEDVVQGAREIKPELAGGKRLGNGVVDLTGEKPDAKAESVKVDNCQVSILQAPSFWNGSGDTEESKEEPNRVIDPSRALTGTKSVAVSVASDYQKTAEISGRAMRVYLATKENFLALGDEIRSLQTSLKHQKESVLKLSHERSQLLKESPGAPTDGLLFRLNEIKESEMNCDRIIAQLTNRLSQVTESFKAQQRELAKTKTDARLKFQQTMRVLILQYDPSRLSLNRSPLVGTKLESSMEKNHVMLAALSRRQVGGPSRLITGQLGRRPTIGGASKLRKSLIASRLSHAVTINCHLTFPIYCLRFDRSGRYFVTGADDCLVKLFYIGAAKSQVERPTHVRGSPHRIKFSYGANEHGAVLVCTLRGHAGVICDIDISADNSFLATASDDGDVRVWGLKDGCPVAILRGHAGGANMVSWSSLTPFRLVTTGMDGLARVWDIREAAKKRYGSLIGKRLDYTLPLTRDEKKEYDAMTRRSSQSGVAPAALPALPVRNPEPANEHPPDPAANVALPPGAPVGPAAAVAVAAPPPVEPIDPAFAVALPPGQIAIDNLQQNPPGQDQNEGQNAVINPGAFVFNADIDEGVNIVAKLQHGEVQETNAGPGTRARRKLVKVICVARSPRGGEFATGSDDGLCRVWEDRDDWRIQKIDERFDSAVKTASPEVPASSAPLATLAGHMSSITDLHYSHHGDRILTASQRDGNARIWSWSGRAPSGATGNDIRQIVLRLSSWSKTGSTARTERPGRKRRAAGDNQTTSTVTCDVAIWTCDDSKIITSQSCPVRPFGQEIVPGSQLVLIWDSWTGQCLLGIPSAHEMQCPVVVPHPKDPTLMCSAGADGTAKVWDMEAGRILFTHTNKVDSGPVAPNNEKTNISGYLDGSFDPHGEFLILTDDNGRVSVFDCFDHGVNRDGWSAPSWMREQYFGNDYYELYYNTNGYCIERGSEQPPHLAPRAVRCSHSGSPWSHDISGTFRYLNGPSPLPEADVRMKRFIIRRDAKPKPKQSRTAPLSQRHVMSECDPSSIVIIGEIGLEKRATVPELPPIVSNVRERQAPLSNSSNRRTSGNLSSNFRWRDYEDLLREETLNDAGEADGDDEEFVPQRAQPQDDDLSDGFVESDASVDSTVEASNSNSESARARRMRRRRREQSMEGNNGSNVPVRMSARQVRPSRRTIEDSDESDYSEVVDEFMSTNNAPSGPYASDYLVDGHLFRLSDSGRRVRRRWVSRLESTSSYKGIKNYSPQVGDSVVYIPRAHFNLIRHFPTLKAPWQEWPRGSRWPLVRCRVLDVRYRFPYKDFYRRRRSSMRCTSIVAILTLVVTGIPELSDDRQFPWPKPSFVDRQTRSDESVFEVPMFDNDFEEYVIPETLFLWRVKSLEDASIEGNLTGVRVVCYFINEDERDSEDVEMMGFPAKISGVSSPNEDNEDGHLGRSGFECLQIDWGTGDASPASPWELTLVDKEFDIPPPPSLSSIEKKCVSQAIQKCLENTLIREYFGHAVNTEKYSDYLKRIEVPIDFSVVKKRLEASYYANVLSVVSDVKTIRDNCVKYNGHAMELSVLAMEMCTDFINCLQEALSEKGEEIEIKLYERPHTDQVPAELHDTVTEERVSRSRSSGGNHESLRERQPSSLELLPPPQRQPSGDAPSSSASSESSEEESSSSEAEGDPNGKETDDMVDPLGHEGRGDFHGELSDTTGSESSAVVESSESSENDELDERPGRQRNRRNTRVQIKASRQSTRLKRGSARETRNNGHSTGGGTEVGADYDGTETTRPRRTTRSRVSFQEVEESDFEESEEDRVPSRQKSKPHNISIRLRPSRRVSRKADEESDAGYLANEASTTTQPVRRSKRVSRSSDDLSTISHSDQPGQDETRPVTRNSSRKQLSRAGEKNDSDASYVSDDAQVKTDESKEDLDFLESSSTRKTVSRSRRPSVHTRGSKDEDSFIDDRDVSESGNDDSSNVGTAVRRENRRSRRNNVGRAHKSSRREPDDDDEFIVEEMDTDGESVQDDDDSLDVGVERRVSNRRVSRTRGRKQQATVQQRSTRVQSRTRTTSNSSVRVSNRLRSVPKTNFADVSSDIDEHLAEMTHKRNVDEVSARDRRAAKRRRTSTQMLLPDMEEWPVIKPEAIPKLANHILDAMESLDDSEIFHVPVVEKFPSVAVAYSKKIEHPMDFRTIREERLPEYTEIRDLQNDLRLVFNNCAVFNQKTAYAAHAEALWSQVNEVFVNSCRETSTRIPRSWKTKT